MKIVASAIAILIFAAGIGHAAEEVEEEKEFLPRVEFELNYWAAALDSTAKFNDEGQGTEFSMKDDLGMDDSGVPGFKFKLFTGPKSDIRFNIVSFGYSGDNQLSKQITFEGESYLAGTRIKSSLDVIYYGVGWAWRFIGDEDGTVKFGTLVELKGISMNASLEAPDLLQKGSASINALFPTFGLSFSAKAAEKLLIIAEATGISLGDSGYFVDADIGLRFYPIRNISVLGGYRIFNMDAKDSQNFFKFNMSGPYLGASARF
ncbi:hypothetical protein MNBD_NITROSPINAE02-173 [hydrothermal vent metagenome]|uniref:Outer membrane protein beta-barrel domain-containing protein n=1 Tax=hydrothermal vent metagenome TaxID=652676 RepID=A0A3B1CT31_9ZZZZ